MAKYRKKPVVIDAMQWTGKNGEEIKEFAKGFRKIEYDLTPKILRIYTLEGVMEANVGDWIIVGVKGEAYPCKPDIFDLTYEKA